MLLRALVTQQQQLVVLLQNLVLRRVGVTLMMRSQSRVHQGNSSSSRQVRLCCRGRRV
jgi:hypothetical protein